MWELIGRECIRDRIARWNANGDAGRTAAMVEVLAPDVEFQAADSPLLYGRDAVLAYLNGLDDTRDEAGPAGSLAPTGRYVPTDGRPSIRHFTSTMQIDFSSEIAARARTYYMVLSPFGLDHWGRYLDEFGVVEGSWMITRRTITLEGMDPGGWAAMLR